MSQGSNARALPAVAAVAAVCIATAIAPTLAGAKQDKYAGPVDQQIDSSFPPPSVEFKVKYEKNRKKKFVPRSVPKFKELNVGFPCTNGLALFPSDLSGDSKTAVVYPESFGIKKRKFSSTFSEPDFPDDIFTVTGSVPRNGPATGTLRMTAHFDGFPDEGEPPFDCDTGVVNWTAKKL